ncbi:GLPGLI family protein [Flavobacterium sp.]|uniref:GLPGLI family protein n=1 Tax=Flavobacterium sp. TaxID=239 RepID=UPI00286A6F52|nr:GLPGLI family protein [Flavobacterium sp.]
MKYKIIAFLLLSNIVFSQKGIIRYGFIEAFDIGNAKGPDYNAYLVFDKNQSYYVTAKDSLENAQKMNEQKIYENEDGGGSIQNGMKSSKEGDQVVYNIKKNTMWSNILYRKQIYIKEIAPKINWKIEKETKKIGTFLCKKATTSLRGRKYIVWFATEISLPYGPWKLTGLPGLILEAYDTNKSVYWYFKSVEYPTKVKEKVKYMFIPTKVKVLSYEDFKGLQIKEQEIVVEKSKLLKKQFPQIEVITPKLNEMFIECE